MIEDDVINSLNPITYKALIKYLDLEDGRYIKNDKIKYNVSEDNETEYFSWDELWTGVKSDLEKIHKYVQKQNDRIN